MSMIIIDEECYKPTSNFAQALLAKQNEIGSDALACQVYVVGWCISGSMPSTPYWIGPLFKMADQNPSPKTNLS